MVRSVSRHPAIAALFDLSANQGSAPSLPRDLSAGLAVAGISHVVVNTDRLSLPRAALTGSGLRFVVADGPRELYDVVR
ncbi:MAG: hypothetical protein ABIX28_21420 [Vicinamibacterales bacterium]